MGEKFRIQPGPPAWPHLWAVTERLCWTQEVNGILGKDAGGALLKGAYEAVDWKRYYGRLKGTPFYKWAVKGGGILSSGGPAHIAQSCFFSTLGDISTREGDWLAEHPEFNQVLHDIHVETAEQMIDFLLRHAADDDERS
jgi:hypothetical protein